MTKTNPHNPGLEIDSDPDEGRLPRDQIRADWLEDETVLVERLLPLASLPATRASQVSRSTQKLISISREQHQTQGGLEAFLKEYDLSSQEGVVLMCLAEALLRIPDNATADRLIQDKIGSGEWSAHLGHSHSLFVNASTWGLMLTGSIVALDQSTNNIKTLLNRLINRSGEAFIRLVLKEAMQIIARQFVFGRTMSKAIEHSQQIDKQKYLYSYDMLGEAAVNAAQAERYYQAYSDAICELQAAFPESGDAMAMPANRPGISIKLSALHPRLEISQRKRIMTELVPKVIALCTQAMQANIGVTFDAEESSRLELLLDIFETVFADPAFSDWAGLGLAVQTYQKRALAVIDWLIRLGAIHEKIIMLRLVKGAYWDSEIKQAQLAGLENYPVFTRKVNTDLSYIACAQRIARNYQYIFPQFATHNAQTIASVLEIMRNKGAYEFQCLHGMGQAVYEALGNDLDIPVRVYAPVGRHRKLLPYLVRRLLENGANTSFLNQLADLDTDIESLITPPDEQLIELIQNRQVSHPEIPPPPAMYQPLRENSAGMNLMSPDLLNNIESTLRQNPGLHKCSCLVNGKPLGESVVHFSRPDNQTQIASEISQANADIVQRAMQSSRAALPEWQETDVIFRAAALDKMAELLQLKSIHLMQLLSHEGGRCPADAVSEIREAVDYCRYYSALARQALAERTRLPGPVGELNQLTLTGRGVYFCISPWNFPLAIFTGQIAAALVCGNTVIAKPAHQTSAIGFYVVKLFHEAGIPVSVLQLLLGDGKQISEQLFAQDYPDGICFTGSSDTALAIQKQFMQTHNRMLPMIAETGGLNCMIADSSALLEQLVIDVIQSAFNSAGQRCSSLRILYIQQEILDDFLAMLCGAMQELTLGPANEFATDIGPVIDHQAGEALQSYIQHTMQHCELVLQLAVPIQLEHGNFVPPCVFLCTPDQLPREEVFGPVLHVVSYESDGLDQVIEQINSTGYGLTLGIHSRIHSTSDYIYSRVHAGNVYVNRNMIGAVVGVQPFGGSGLSGTGPKAGGSHYLQAFMTERCLSVNTAAIGGDASLLSLSDIEHSK